MEIITQTFAPNLKIVIKISTILFCSVIITATANSQNSLIHNHDFETTNWQSIAWFSQTNMGNPIIVNQNEPFFVKDGIVAHSGLYFAYIGGVESPAGLYDGEISQEFTTTAAGRGQLDFYVRYLSPSVDPGSYITIKIDDEVVWSVSPHYIVDVTEDYELVSLQLGHLEAGNHIISIHGYEYPLGGDAPMKFIFDDFFFSTIETASINDESNIGLNVITTPGNIQIQTSTSLNADASIELVDLSGKVISSAVTYFQNSYSLPVSAMNSGMYILSVKTNIQTLSRKLFINQ